MQPCTWPFLGLTDFMLDQKPHQKTERRETNEEHLGIKNVPGQVDGNKGIRRGSLQSQRLAVDRTHT